MHSFDWDDIRHFLAVVRAGSATQAATDLGINHTTVYRRISALEERLGKQLFERTNNGWLITPAGERIVAHAEAMADEAHGIERRILADNQELRGLLRVTAPDHTLEHMVTPVIRKFVDRYPEVDLELIVTAQELDLAAREADVALRATDEPPPNLLGKRIAQIGFAVYGSLELKERVLADPRATDLPCITWVGDGHTRAPWIEKSFPNTRRIYRTTSVPAMLGMARAGIGLARLGHVLGDPDPLLHRVPANYVEPGPGLWVLSHVDLRSTARVRILRDFLVDELQGQRDLIEGRLGG